MLFFAGLSPVWNFELTVLNTNLIAFTNRGAELVTDMSDLHRGVGLVAQRGLSYSVRWAFEGRSVQLRASAFGAGSMWSIISALNPADGAAKNYGKLFPRRRHRAEPQCYNQGHCERGTASGTTQIKIVGE